MQILEIQNIVVKLARFTLRSSPKWIKLPKSTCFYERNRIMKKRKFEACSCHSCVEINANDTKWILSTSLDGENWVSQEYLYKLTYILEPK